MGAAGHSHSTSHQGSHHGPQYYVKMWGILLVLLIISVIGPELGIPLLTLITAFGIALVKAYMVAAYFMHLNTEKRYIHYMLYTMLLFMAIFFAGVCVDVMRPKGEHWENKAALSIIEADKERMSSGVKAKEH
jgi:caa(3)-type oxidase subunit IV